MLMLYAHPTMHVDVLLWCFLTTFFCLVCPLLERKKKMSGKFHIVHSLVPSHKEMHGLMNLGQFLGSHSVACADKPSKAWVSLIRAIK